MLQYVTTNDKNLLEQVKILAVTCWKHDGLFHSMHEHDATLLVGSKQARQQSTHAVRSSADSDI